jgi:hypothetical protein
MRTARLAVTADTLGVSPSHGRAAGSDSTRRTRGRGPSREPSADRRATRPQGASAHRAAIPLLSSARTAPPAEAGSGVAARSDSVGDPNHIDRTTAGKRLPSEHSAQPFGTRQGRRGRRVREQILVRRAAPGRTGPSPLLAHLSPHTSRSVSPARRGAILQRTRIGCNTNATGTITYPIAVREVSRTRCKSALFDAEWLARILFAGRGYLERGR